MTARIRSLIVDDEALARRRLERLLEPFPDIEVVGQVDCGTQAVLEIERLTPALAFLDIQMPDLDGFEVLSMLEAGALPEVVFVTAYDQYAIQAFEHAALDYLLKPVRPERLGQAVERVRRRLASPASGAEGLQELLRLNLNRSQEYLKRIPVRSRQSIRIVPIDQVAGLRLEDGLVYVQSVEGEFWSKYTTLSQVEGLLDPQCFMRVHRQYIVNLNHVREVQAFDNQTARLILSSGHRAQVSRSHMKGFRKVLDW